MLKSILIGLDRSGGNTAVVELGIRWARRHEALAVGIAVVDAPGVFASEGVLFAGGHAGRTAAAAPLLSRAREEVEQLLRDFTRRCGAAGVACKTLEDVGTPFVQILMEVQCYDLLLLGQEAHFDYGREGGPDETLDRVLEDSPRPLVAVPATPGAGEAVVVAYDGSLQAARALYAFEASGLGVGRTVHVVSVAAEHQDAVRHADRAVVFLRLHGIEALPHHVETSVPAAEVILRKVRSLDAGLLVVGAYGQPVLREFFLGSVTRTVLKESPVPVFCYH